MVQGNRLYDAFSRGVIVIARNDVLDNCGVPRADNNQIKANIIYALDFDGNGPIGVLLETAQDGVISDAAVTANTFAGFAIRRVVPWPGEVAQPALGRAASRPVPVVGRSSGQWSKRATRGTGTSRPLRALGIDLVQGHVLYTALPPSQLEQPAWRAAGEQPGLAALRGWSTAVPAREG